MEVEGVTAESFIARWSGREGGHEFSMAAVEEVFDGCDNQVVFGGEVVQLRAARDTGALGDFGGRGAGEAESIQASDGGVEEPGARAGAALSLGAPGAGVQRSRG